jgi:hypothetical protein
MTLREIDIEDFIRKTQAVSGFIILGGGATLLFNLMLGDGKYDETMATVDFPLDNSVRGIVNIAGIVTVVLGIVLVMLAPCLVQTLSKCFDKPDKKDPEDQENDLGSGLD